MDELQKDLRHNRILKETNIVKIMKHVEILISSLNDANAIHSKNALASLAYTIFSNYNNDTAISKLHKYIKYPSIIGNNIKKRNDYISEFYNEMLVYDDTKIDIDKLKRIESKLRKLTNLL